MIIFGCTVLSGFGGATVWKGSAFDCARSDNEVVLLHSRIESNEHTRRTCNNGTIIGETIQVVENYYTSRLHVMVSPDMIGEGIECVSDDGTVMVMGSSTITATMGMYGTDIIIMITFRLIIIIFLVPFQSPKGLSDLGSSNLFSAGVHLPWTVLPSITTS